MKTSFYLSIVLSDIHDCQYDFSEVSREESYPVLLLIFEFGKGETVFTRRSLIGHRCAIT